MCTEAVRLPQTVKRIALAVHKDRGHEKSLLQAFKKDFAVAERNE